MLSLGITLAACGPTGPTATPLPAATITPRATLLPTVPTAVPFGSADRPFEVVIVPPPDSSATGTSLASFLTQKTTVGTTSLAFKVNIVSNYADVLASLCSSSPTFAWVDGWTLLAAQAKGCGTSLLLIKRGEATGIKSDLVVSPSSLIDSLTVLRNRAKTRDFCRMGSQDSISWILPVITMRSAAPFDPLNDFRSIKDYSDVTTMLSDVSDNKCVAAIESGTLSNYKIPNVSDITRTVKVLATSPELPYGGLMASNAVPANIADQVAKLFQRNPDQLQSLVVADSLVPATSSDLTDIQGALNSGGVDLASLGQ